MPKAKKIISFLLCFFFIFEQSGFAQVAGSLGIPTAISGLNNIFIKDKFRPLHLRSLSYDAQSNKFNLLLDKGDEYKGFSLQAKGLSPKGADPKQIENATKGLLNYFFIGLTLPNSAFWVNLRPDAEDNIIDGELAQTDVGKILLEADLQLKKDTAKYTSPETPEGKEYWDKLYQKAQELFGDDNITIPTLIRPWIVPGEIILRETPNNAYIYKATLKVMLEQDYLKGSALYSFDDPRLKALNEYSSQLIRELIIPKLTREINASKKYAALRQVYYSLILAQWFKEQFATDRDGSRQSNNETINREPSLNNAVPNLIDSKNLTGLESKTPWSKAAYFKAYQKSVKSGEYNIQQSVYSPSGQTIRTYFSGGLAFKALMSQPVMARIPGNAGRTPSGQVIGVSFIGGPQEGNIGITREAPPAPIPAGLDTPGASLVGRKLQGQGPRTPAEGQAMGEGSDVEQYLIELGSPDLSVADNAWDILIDRVKRDPKIISQLERILDNEVDPIKRYGIIDIITAFGPRSDAKFRIIRQKDQEKLFDELRRKVEESMPFVDAGSALLPGENVELEERFLNPAILQYFAWAFDNNIERTIGFIKLARSYAKAITSLVESTRVYYIGFGATDEPGNRLDIICPLLETDFAELIGAEIRRLSFKKFQELVNAQIEDIVDSGTAINFVEEQKQKYAVTFTYMGKPRKVIAYYNFDGNKGYPEELKSGYNVLIEGAYGGSIPLLDPNAGFIISMGSTLGGAGFPGPQGQYSNFSEINSVPFFALGYEVYTKILRSVRGGIFQHRPVLLATNGTVERLRKLKENGDGSDLSKGQGPGTPKVSAPGAASGNEAIAGIGPVEFFINNRVARYIKQQGGIISMLWGRITAYRNRKRASQSLQSIISESKDKGLEGEMLQALQKEESQLIDVAVNRDSHPAVQALETIIHTSEDNELKKEAKRTLGTAIYQERSIPALTQAVEEFMPVLKEIILNSGDKDLRIVVLNVLRYAAYDKSQPAARAIEELIPDLKEIVLNSGWDDFFLGVSAIVVLEAAATQGKVAGVQALETIALTKVDNLLNTHLTEALGNVASKGMPTAVLAAVQALETIIRTSGDNEMKESAIVTLTVLASSQGYGIPAAAQAITDLMPTLQTIILIPEGDNRLREFAIVALREAISHQEVFDFLVGAFIKLADKLEISSFIADSIAKLCSKASTEFSLPAELKEALDKALSGKMDVNNPWHLLANYIDLVRKSNPLPEGEKGINYQSYYEIIQRAQGALAQEGGTVFIEEDMLNIRGLAYEAFLMREKILEAEKRAQELGRKIIVIANLSYGGVALAPISEERNSGDTYISGTDIPVWYTKVGSSESHGNEVVLTDNLFTPGQLKILAEDNPFVVVVDGSTSVSDPTRTSPHIPDGFKGYRNFYIVLNQALYGNVNPAEFYVDAELVKGLLDTPSAKELIKIIQGMSIKPRAPSNAYKFRFWYERKAGPQPDKEEFLYLRVNKEKETLAPKVDISRLDSPTCIFIQSAVHPQDIPPLVQREFIGGEHTPAYFDDKDNFKKFYFNYEDGYGLVHSRRYIYQARQTFLEFMRRQGRQLTMRVATSGKIRTVETIVLDLDGTVVATDAPLDNGAAGIINHLLAEGKRVVIITEDIAGHLDDRLRKINKGPNLFVFSDGGTNGYTFDSAGNKLYFETYNLENRIAPVKQRILDIISSNFTQGAWQMEDRGDNSEERKGRISRDYRVDLRNVLNRTDFVTKLQGLLDNAGIQAKVYKVGGTSVRVVLRHKEDALRYFLEGANVDKSRVLIIADSAHTRGVDRGLLTALPEGISINVGGFSPTISRENRNIVQYDLGGVEATLKLLSNLSLYGGLPDNLIAPSFQGQPWDEEREPALSAAPGTPAEGQGFNEAEARIIGVLTAQGDTGVKEAAGILLAAYKGREKLLVDELNRIKREPQKIRELIEAAGEKGAAVNESMAIEIIEEVIREAEIRLALIQAAAGQGKDKSASDAGLKERRAWKIFLTPEDIREFAEEINRSAQAALPLSTLVSVDYLVKIARENGGFMLINLSLEQVQNLPSHPGGPDERYTRVKEGFKEGVDLPPIAITIENGEIWVADGKTRVVVAKELRLGLKAYVPVNMRADILAALEKSAVVQEPSEKDQPETAGSSAFENWLQSTGANADTQQKLRDISVKLEKREELTPEEQELWNKYLASGGLLRKESATPGGIDASAPLSINSQGGVPGGIDFRALPIQSLGTFPLSSQVKALAGTVPKLDNLNLDAEWRKIEDSVEQGNIPSAESIKGYIQASCLKGSADKDIDKVLSCIADILRLEEDFYLPTEPLLIDILTAVESANSLPELKAAFIGNP